MILSLDISLNTGWAFGGGGNIVFGTRRFETHTADYAVLGRRFHDFVADLITDHEPKIIAIERPFFPSNNNMKSNRILSGLVWEAHRVAEVREVVRVEFAPVTIKKFITGNARASKEDVMRAVQALGHKITNDHEADAVAMLLCQENRGEQ